MRVSERPTSAAVALAERFYVAAAGEAWATLGDCARALLARDAHQVLGRDLDSPVRFVVCWTPAGDRDGRDPRSGGTGQALRIAAARSLPVFNIANPDDLEADLQALASTQVQALSRSALSGLALAQFDLLAASLPNLCSM